MTPELWQRLKPLFHAALDRATADREAFIHDACGDDLELKENLVQLVRAAQDGTRTLDAPLFRPLPPQAARFSPGEVILGRFRIVRPIGRGGMGEVYEAEDLQLGRIALKTIRDGIASSSGAFDRFRQEVQTARKVSGSQVCRIHELYLLPASGGHAATAFLTMEYLDGITLSDKLKDNGPLPVKLALRAALDICEGLRLVHGNGVIHRDLKSANIMLCGQDGALRAVLMDFGLARDFSSDIHSAGGAGSPEGNAGTLPGAIMGTPAYMAPEQFEGKPVSPATDIYALGIVLYELVTGLHPYAAPTPFAAAIRRAHHPAPPSSLNRAIPRKWDRVIQRCLQYEPANRYQSAQEVAKALQAGPANLGNLRQDRPWLFRLACAVILALFVWGISILWQTWVTIPPKPAALRWYNPGLSSMREGNYVKATRLLQAAISQDEHFVMAHARLAEAWFNLDFQGSAQQELLIALPGRSRLPPLDGMYLDAIQATVTGDSSSAIRAYEKILDRLQGVDRSSGFVDLGLAYERAGDVANALGMYSRAAAQDSNNPAAYMHTGVLQTGLHRVEEAERAFDRAQAIFTAEVNPEGLAELDYQRGFAANDRGDSKEAEIFLQRSLDEAQKIPSVQLEIRALSQLSGVEYSSDRDALAVETANRAIQLARANQLESWAANGLARLANAELNQGHLRAAEEAVNESLQLVQQSPQPRVQAIANFTLASLMDQEHLPAKVVEPAEAALRYYQRNGLLINAIGPAVLLVRAKKDLGQYKQALESGNELLALANRTGVLYARAQAEEAVGSIEVALERYPDALTHFQNARLLADSDTLRAYEVSYCADTLWRLGRYTESEALLKIASGTPALLSIVGESRVESLLSQQKYKPALALAQQIIAKDPELVAERKRDLELDEAVAEAHLGMKKQAQAGLSAIAAPDQPGGNPTDAARQKLAAAEVYLWMGMNQQAREAALATQDTFASNGQRDSELRSAFLAAAAAKSLKDDDNYRSLSKKVLDILQQLQQDWGLQSYRKYISRPDMHLLTQGAQIKAN